MTDPSPPSGSPGSGLSDAMSCKRFLNLSPLIAFWSNQSCSSWSGSGSSLPTCSPGSSKPGLAFSIRPIKISLDISRSGGRGGHLALIQSIRSCFKSSGGQFSGFGPGKPGGFVPTCAHMFSLNQPCHAIGYWSANASQNLFFSWLQYLCASPECSSGLANLSKCAPDGDKLW